MKSAASIAAISASKFNAANKSTPKLPAKSIFCPSVVNNIAGALPGAITRIGCG